jgi:hypothetical protein
MFAAIALAAPVAPVSAQQQTPPDTAGTAVTGDVYDSVDVAPIGDAMVQLVSQANEAVTFTTTSDSAGHFRIAHVPPGKYLLGFLDESLSELGLTSVERVVEVGAAPVDHMMLAIPGAGVMHDRICGSGKAGDSSAVMVGFVRDAATGTPLGASTVVAVRRQVTIDDGGVHNDRREVPAKTAPSGWFAVCGLPSDRPLEVRAELGGRATGFIEVNLSRHGILIRDFDVGSDSAVASSAESSASPLGEPLRHGTARLAGVVTDSSGRLLEGAHVTVWGSSTGVTSATGNFTLDSLPSGTSTLEAQYLGFQPVRLVIDPAPGRTDTVRLVMSKAVRVLAAVQVTSKMALMRYHEFDERRKTGTGHYYTAADVTKNKPEYLSDFFYMVPGIRVMPIDGADFTLVSTHGGGITSMCSPAIWINNIQFRQGGLNQMVLPEDVTGIEVYDASNAPPRYRIGGCGVILIWTK